MLLLLVFLGEEKEKERLKKEVERLDELTKKKRKFVDTLIAQSHKQKKEEVMSFCNRIEALLKKHEETIYMDPFSGTISDDKKQSDEVSSALLLLDWHMKAIEKTIDDYKKNPETLLKAIKKNGQKL